MKLPMKDAPISGEAFWLHVPGEPRVRAWFDPGIPMQLRECWRTADGRTFEIGLYEGLEWEPVTGPQLVQ